MLVIIHIFFLQIFKSINIIRIILTNGIKEKMRFLQTKTPEGYVWHGAYVGIWYEGIVIIICILLLIDLYRIYRITKLKLSLYLIQAFIFVLVSVFFTWLGKFWLWKHVVTDYSGPYWLQLIYTFKISIACVIVANFFMSMFFKEIFSKDDIPPPKRKITIIRKIIEITIVLTCHIPA